jgi:hypothetical protein
LGLPPGSDLSILLAREAVETTRRTDGIVTPEAVEALMAPYGAGGSFAYFAKPVRETGGAMQPDGLPFTSKRLTSGERILAPNIEQLLQVAQLRVKRSFTTEECRQYLHVPECPRR